MTADKLTICEELREYARDWHNAEVCDKAAAIIEGLVEALDYFATRKTIDEFMQSGDRSDYAGLTAEQRIEEMGRRKRENDAAILAAREALAKVRAPHHPDEGGRS